MISKFIISHFIKDYENVSNEKVRNSYGYLGSVIGIIINSILFAVKLSVGIIVHSIAVTADAFNNLSDAASSLITIIGFKLASKPADEEHPFGHGRIEYISGLIVSFMVLLVGFEFTKSSFSRVLNPSKVKFELVPFILILISILMKVWLSKFNKFVGNKIDSAALKASGVDALSDVITSSCVALSLALSKITDFPVDGYIGVLVSLFILYSGYSLIKETLSPLLGEAPDPELAKNIIKGVVEYENITGAHDLVIHNYGPGRFMATVHAEVPYNIPILKLHEIVDRAENELSEKLNIILVIHMDPINTDDKEVNYTKNEVIKIIHDFPMIKSIHDFRIVGEGEIKNVLFDIVVDYSQELTLEFEQQIKNDLNASIKKIHPHYNAVISIDRDYTPIK